MKYLKHMVHLGLCCTAGILLSQIFFAACGGSGGKDASTDQAASVNDDGNLSQPGDVNQNAGESQSGAAPTSLVEVPNPLSDSNPVYPLQSISAPAPGSAVYDPDFGTTQTRVTQTQNQRHEYSRYDPFNSNQSMIILNDINSGDLIVYRTNNIPYDQADNLVLALDVEEPRWDPNNPQVIWGLRDFRILTVNVETGQYNTVKDFSQDPTLAPVLQDNPDLYRITRRFEGESSRDMRFWAVLIQGSEDDYRARYILTWDRSTDRVLGLYELSAEESLIDWVGMSTNGSWVVIGGDWDNGGNVGPGLVMANKELTLFHQIEYTTAHADVGLDTNGNEVIVMQNPRTDYIDLIPLELGSRPISDGYQGTNHIPLVRLFYDSESPHGFNGGIHISCNCPGYCVVSTEVEAGVSQQNWLDRTITLVKLDPTNPRVFHLAKVYGSTGAYWEETQAVITNNCSRVVWASNWSQNVGQEQVWDMQLDMPAGWQ